MVLPPSMQGSLPAGWLAFTGRESNPLDHSERFQITFSFPLPGLLLTQRSPLSTVPAGIIVPAFPQRSPPRHLIAAACGGLRSAPDCRTRRVDEDVAILIPHSPGCAGFPLPVLHERASLAKV